MKLSIPQDEFVSSGHLACQGCGGALAMRYALKALGPNTIVTIPACCWSVIAGPFPHTALKVPLYNTAFETGAAVSAGVRAAARIQGENDTTILTWAGDGGTFDIGLQALSGAAERNEDIIFAVYDNEAYMNTGIQRSSSTPYGAWTTTTPTNHFKKRPKKNIIKIMAAHVIPYVATASVAYPEDFIRKFKKAKTMRGTKFIHITAPCPVGWRAQSSQTIKIARLAVQTCLFPLIEIFDGTEYHITKNIKNPKPVSEYLKIQGRFKHLTEDQISSIQQTVDQNWKELKRSVKRDNITEKEITPAR